MQNSSPSTFRKSLGHNTEEEEWKVTGMFIRAYSFINKDQKNSWRDSRWMDDIEPYIVKNRSKELSCSAIQQ